MNTVVVVEDEDKPLVSVVIPTLPKRKKLIRKSY